MVNNNEKYIDLIETARKLGDVTLMVTIPQQNVAKDTQVDIPPEDEVIERNPVLKTIDWGEQMRLNDQTIRELEEQTKRTKLHEVDDSNLHVFTAIADFDPPIIKTESSTGTQCMDELDGKPYPPTKIRLSFILPAIFASEASPKCMFLRDTLCKFHDHKPKTCNIISNRCPEHEIIMQMLDQMYSGVEDQAPIGTVYLDLDVVEEVKRNHVFANFIIKSLITYYYEDIPADDVYERVDCGIAMTYFPYGWACDIPIRIETTPDKSETYIHMDKDNNDDDGGKP